MKKILLLSVLALAATFAISAQEQTTEAKKQYKAYGVAFYNLENLFDTIANNPLERDLEFTPRGARGWDTHKYSCKLHNLARAISNFKTDLTPNGPAIIGISEIENRTVVQDLINQPELKDWHLQIAEYHDSPDRRGVDVGLIYNPRYFRVLSVNNHTLFIESNPDLRTRDQMCVTGVLGGTDTISVIVNHWPSRLGGEEQSSYLREAAGALSRHIADSVMRLYPNSGVIMMGDLNDDPQNKSCAVAFGARRSIEEVEQGGFYNPFWKMLDRGIGTLAYRGGWNLFDQIIVSDYFINDPTRTKRLQLLKPIVMNFDFLKDSEGQRAGYPLRTHSGGVWMNGYSDHFPTQILLVREAK